METIAPAAIPARRRRRAPDRQAPVPRRAAARRRTRSGPAPARCWRRFTRRSPAPPRTATASMSAARRWLGLSRGRRGHASPQAIARAAARPPLPTSPRSGEVCARTPASDAARHRSPAKSTLRSCPSRARPGRRSNSGGASAATPRATTPTSSATWFRARLARPRRRQRAHRGPGARPAGRQASSWATRPARHHDRARELGAREHASPTAASATRPGARRLTRRRARIASTAHEEDRVGRDSVISKFA